MSGYPYLLFVHVAGAIGVFVALAVEHVASARLAHAPTPTEARLWLALLARPARIAPLAMIATLGSGMWLMHLVWGFRPWIGDAVAGLVVMAVSGALALRRLPRLRAVLATEHGDAISHAARAQLLGGGWVFSLRLRIALAIGILGLMTVRPSATGSALVLVVAALVGLAIAAAEMAIASVDRQSADRAQDVEPSAPGAPP